MSASHPSSFLLSCCAALLAACATAPLDAPEETPVITTQTIEPASAGRQYHQGLSSEGGQPPLVWILTDAGPYDAWLQIDSTSGQLKGFPRDHNLAAPIVVSIQDAASHTSSRTLSLGVEPCHEGATLDCAASADGACRPGASTCQNGTFSPCDPLKATSNSVEACGPDCQPCGAVADRCPVGKCWCGEGGEVCEPGKHCCGDTTHSDPQRPGVKCADVRTDLDNCGACGAHCDKNLLNGTSVCEAGQCKYDCAPGWSDCSSNPNDHNCSIHTAVDVLNCGNCNQVCPTLSPTVHAAPSCSEGRCTAQCQNDWASCGSLYQSGCPYHLPTDVFHCGSCENNCAVKPNVQSAACQASGCVITLCKPGFADCNNDPADGCEINLASDINHCGSCEHSCNELLYTNSVCEAGACRITSCEPGHGDCDNFSLNGCELFLNTDANCGVCGKACDTGSPLRYHCNPAAGKCCSTAVVIGICQ